MTQKEYFSNSKGQTFHRSIGGIYPVNTSDPQTWDEDYLELDAEEMQKINDADEARKAGLY